MKMSWFNGFFGYFVSIYEVGLRTLCFETLKERLHILSIFLHSHHSTITGHQSTKTDPEKNVHGISIPQVVKKNGKLKPGRGIWAWLHNRGHNQLYYHSILSGRWWPSD